MQTASSPTPDLALPTAGLPGYAGVNHHRFFPELIRRLTAWREASQLRQALDLAGQPNSILDIPCGTGRLWPLLLEKSNRLLIGADDCTDMLIVAQAAPPPGTTGNLHYLRTAPEVINLHDCAVDCIFCVRLFSRVGSATHRQQLLREFHRVTRDTLILSLWVDGNLQSWQRATAHQARVTGETPGPRFVVSRQQIESEFAAVGFERLGHFDSFPFYRMTRTYVLRKL
ncbi:MAG: class I SAM-dependent methyltransferase [Desulfuromonas sp.]|nr:class I SAM-dependent methyltransferase [Desulfuromonas sp.]